MVTIHKPLERLDFLTVWQPDFLGSLHDDYLYNSRVTSLPDNPGSPTIQRPPSAAGVTS